MKHSSRGAALLMVVFILFLLTLWMGLATRVVTADVQRTRAARQAAEVRQTEMARQAQEGVR